MGLLLADGKTARHPLSFLTEAADDICYRMLDMEDAVAMRIFPEKPIKDLFLKIAGFRTAREVTIGEARGRAIGKLIEEAWVAFEESYEDIMCGNRSSDLKSSFEKKFSEEFEEIGVRYKEIFIHRAKLSYEIGSYKILGRIIKSLILSVQSLCRAGEYKKIPFISKKCFELAWGVKFTEINQANGYEWWLQQIFDYVSGLTDNYAIQVSREIEGVISVS